MTLLANVYNWSFLQVVYKYKSELEFEDEEDITCYDGDGTVSCKNDTSLLKLDHVNELSTR